MISAITTGVTTVLGYVAEVVTAIFGTSGDLAALLPVIGLVIGAGFLGRAIRTIKGLVWGM